MPKKPRPSALQPATAATPDNRPQRVRPANRRSPHHAAQEARAQANRARALELRIAGHSVREIATALGVSHSTAGEYVQTAMVDLSAAACASRDQWRAIETERIEIAVKAVMVYLGPDAPEIRTEQTDANGNLREVTVERYTATMRAAEVLAKLSARLSSLWGLDAPNKQEVSGPGGGPVELHHTFTPERQAQLASRARALIEGLPKAPEHGPGGGQN